MLSHQPSTCTEQGLNALFAPYGDIERVKLVMDLQTGGSKGFGFVRFRTAKAATQATAALNGLQIENKRLRVALAHPGGQTLVVVDV
jgi:RNA recognition motif-containing protein